MGELEPDVQLSQSTLKAFLTALQALELLGVSICSSIPSQLSRLKALEFRLIYAWQLQMLFVLTLNPGLEFIMEIVFLSLTGKMVESPLRK